VALVREQSLEITSLLKEWSEGDEAAFQRLVPLVYDDLRRLARRHLRWEREGHTLNTTALVHEAYINLVDQKESRIPDRARFFALASRVMRNILVDYARRRLTEKRGGARQPVRMEEGLIRVDENVEELLALDEALTQLRARDPRLERVVECRFFGGMHNDETATALGVSARTVERDWTRAKTYLYRTLQQGPSNSGVRVDSPHSES
jgi:RNA polymerase sigma factor (TIGR02999 family)